jgi:hypothetical protein
MLLTFYTALCMLPHPQQNVASSGPLLCCSDGPCCLTIGVWLLLRVLPPPSKGSLATALGKIIAFDVVELHTMEEC